MNLSSDFIEQVISNNVFMSALLSLLIAVTLLKSIFKVVASIKTIHEEEIWKRKLKRYQYLLSNLQEKSATKDYLHSLIEIESFRLLTGVYCSKEKAEFLIKIMEDGKLNQEQLLKTSSFIRIDKGKAQIEISNLDRLTFLWSQLSTSIAAILMLYSIAPLMISGELTKLLAAMLLLIILSLFLFLVSKDYITSRYLIQVKEAMDGIGLLDNPNVKIRWDMSDLTGKAFPKTTKGN